MINGRVVIHLRAPVLTNSGYGGHAREVLDYLLANDDKFIVALESINWGSCGFLHRKDFKDENKFNSYLRCIAAYEQLKDQNQFDLAIHVTIPNEFKRTAKVCVGVTAGLEVDRVPREWIHKCNEMDLIVVPSEHSAKVLAGTVYGVTNRDTNETTDERVTTPIFIIPEYFEHPVNIEPLDVKFDTKKNLLFVGQWGTKGGFGEDRKNVANLIKLFLMTFKDDSDVGLILKSQLVNGCARDAAEIKNRIQEIKQNFGDGVKCKIHLIHQDLTDDEMWGLYSHPQVTGLISLSHGEGLGRPLLEAASVGKPVLATNWSGHLDFLRAKHGFIPLKFEMAEIPDCQVWEGVIDKGSRWAKVDEKDVMKRMSKFISSPRDIEKQAISNVEWLKDNFSKEAAFKKWDDFFGKFIKPVSEKETAEVAPEFEEYELRKKQATDQLRDLIEESEKQKVLYIMPQSAGDCLMSTAIIDSLILNRHMDTDYDFYIATNPQYKELFSKLVDDYGVKVVDYNHNLMFNSELTREVWDYVYSPGINVQFVFSNWLLGNGEYSVRLLEEFAKNCNLSPNEITNYQVKLEECTLPDKAYLIVAPGGEKSSKTYKYWPDVISNLKEMLPGVDIVQVGSSGEQLLDGVLDYRGRTYSESFFVIKNALMLIGGDSFPAHAAAAMETPHIVLYASTDAHTCAPVLLTKKEVPQIAIEESSQCKPRCYKDQCRRAKDGKNCLSHIDPSSICSCAYNMLEKLLENVD